MKIALTTIGSRGDVQPYIALGLELQQHGHSAAIITHPWAKQTVEQYGLTHITAGDDIDINYCAKQFVENSSSNLKGFAFALNFIYDRLRNCHKDLLSALKDFDLVIGHGIVGEAEAEILGKPFITVSIAPMGLQKEYWKTKNVFWELHQFLSGKIMGALFGRPYSRFRKEMGVSDLKHKASQPYLAIIPIPLFLQKPNPNWKETTEITGYFFADTPESYAPSPELYDFLNQGEKPVLITFGSMFHNRQQTEQLYVTICEALDKSGARAILIMPDIKEIDFVLPGNVFLAEQIPYSWLLHRVSSVVHHFGFGTTAEVLKAGLPSIPIPHIFDQKIRAAKIYKLGYACKPLNIEKINSTMLSDAISKVNNNHEMKKKCLEAAQMISNENGVKKALDLINKHIEKIGSNS